MKPIVFLLVLALSTSCVLTGVQGACTMDTCGACVAGGTCQWCGDYSHGQCIDFMHSCIGQDDATSKTARSAEQCPPKTETVLLPVLGAYLGVTVLIILQHLIEMRWDRVPANLTNELDDFSHLAPRDRRVVSEFAGETIRYADYGRKIQRDTQFIWLLGIVSAGVAYTVYYQERLGESGWTMTALWIFTIMLLLVLKAMAKTAIYILTEDKAVIITPKYLGVCGNSYRLIMPHRTTSEVFLAVRPDGVGSVYFANDTRFNDSDRPDPYADSLSEQQPDLVGFTGILRAGEVHELVAAWRARRLGLDVPTIVNPPPKKRQSTLDKIQNWVLIGIFAVFLAVFVVLTMATDKTGTKWLFIMVVPYGAIWSVVGGVYLWRAWLRWRRKGFMQLGAQSGVVFGDWSDDIETSGAVGRAAPAASTGPRPATVPLDALPGGAALGDADEDSDIEVDLRTL